jgi:N-dimethylarginine dimethylaminohydrolase
MTPLQRGIKKVVEENCKKGLYGEAFSPEFQKEIKQRAEEVAVLVTEDEDFANCLNSAIEEAIRVMILR